MQVQRYGLRRDRCEWWGAPVEVLPYALILDFVLSDSKGHNWDNNNRQVCTDHLHPKDEQDIAAVLMAPHIGMYVPF